MFFITNYDKLRLCKEEILTFFLQLYVILVMQLAQTSGKDHETVVRFTYQSTMVLSIHGRSIFLKTSTFLAYILVFLITLYSERYEFMVRILGDKHKSARVLSFNGCSYGTHAAAQVFKLWPLANKIILFYFVLFSLQNGPLIRNRIYSCEL